MGDTLIITLPEGDEQRLASLYQWLRQSPRVTANSTVSLESEAAPGTMGDRLARITLGVTSGLAGMQLIISAITAWQEIQQAPAPVVVKVDTVVVQVDGGAPDDIRRITDALAAGKGGDGAAGGQGR